MESQHNKNTNNLFTCLIAGILHSVGTSVVASCITIYNGYYRYNFTLEEDYLNKFLNSFSASAIISIIFTFIAASLFMLTITISKTEGKFIKCLILFCSYFFIKLIAAPITMLIYGFSMQNYINMTDSQYTLWYLGDSVIASLAPFFMRKKSS